MIARVRQALELSGGEGLRKAFWSLQRRLGLAGVLAMIALILAAVTLIGLAAHRLGQPSAAPVSAVKSPDPNRAASTDASVQTPEVQPTDALMRQWLTWPLEATHSQDLERLTALAQAQGVVIDSGRVRRLASDDSPIVQIELELSLLQPWSKVRTFLASALNRAPHLALQSIRLSRDEPSATEVDAELIFRWVYRRGEVQ